MIDCDVEAFGVFLNPSHILVDVCGVDDEKEVVVAAFVDEQVVDRTAVGVEHHAVEDLAVGHVADIICEDMVDEAFGVMAGHGYFSHVRHVKDSAGITHGAVLFFDAGILDRHIEAPEGAHQRAEGDVEVMETGSFNFLSHDILNDF